MLSARKSLHRNKYRCDERPTSQAMDLARNGKREETSPDEARQDAAMAAALYLKIFCDDAGTHRAARDLGRSLIAGALECLSSSRSFSDAGIKELAPQMPSGERGRTRAVRGP
jgi:hypothetical protein